MFYDLIIFGAAEVIMFEKMDLKKVKPKLTLSLHHVIIAYTAQMEKAERSEEGKSLTPLASNMINDWKHRPELNFSCQLVFLSVFLKQFCGF